MRAMCRLGCSCAPTWFDSRELEPAPESGSRMLVTSGATWPESRAQSFVRAGATWTVTLPSLCNASTKSFDIAVRVGPPGRQRNVPRASRPRHGVLARHRRGRRTARSPTTPARTSPDCSCCRRARTRLPMVQAVPWEAGSMAPPQPEERRTRHGWGTPPGAQVLFHCCHRVEAVGRIEPVGGLLDRADPVDPVGADRVSAMGVTQEVPAPVADDDRPGVHLGFPLVAGLAPIRDQHATPGRDGSDECAGGGGIRTGRVPVGRS